MANKYPEMQQLLLLHFHRSAGKDLFILRTMQWLIGNFSRCHQYHLVTFVVSLFPKMRIVACLPCQLRLLFTDYPRQLTPHREGCCKIINICICPRAAGCSIRMNYSGPYRIAMKKCVKLQSELFIALQTKVGASLQWIVTFCLTMSHLCRLPPPNSLLQNVPKSRALGIMLQKMRDTAKRVMTVI